MNDWKTFKWINMPFKDIETVEGETRYYKVADGVLLPSMTSILGLLDDGGIDAWRKRVGEEEADKIVNEAVARGNHLHFLSEEYLKNNLTRYDVTGLGAALFNRNRKHLNELGPIVGIEVPLYHIEKRYAGRVDCLAFHGKDFCVVDHKNSRNSIDMKKDYGRKKVFKYMIQTCGYAIAFADMFPLAPKPTHGILIVGNHNQSNSRMIKFPLKPLIKEFDIILNAYYGTGDIKQSAFFKL